MTRNKVTAPDQRIFRRRAISLAASLAGLLMLQPQIASADALTDAITKGTTNLDMRLRYETVDQDNTLKQADALTLRTRLGYTTQSWNKFSAMAELENTSALIDDYAPVQAGYSVVADPDDSELNQWGISYAALPGLTASVGRKRVVLDNARWIGNVVWRQNEQTYDGAFLKYAPSTALNFEYAYINNVNNIVFANVDLEGHLANLRWAVLPTLTLVGYAYLLDYEVPATPDLDTYGIRADGSAPLSSTVKLLYTAEYAAQKADTPAGSFDTDYLLGEIGLGFKPLSVRLGYEKLGSDDGVVALQTPLATKYAFNGWADLFLTTPAGGLEDVYLTVTGKLGTATLIASYHEYSADQTVGGVDDYGSEINLSAGMPLAVKIIGLIRYDSYSADEFGVDTDKFWAQLEFKF